MVSKTGRDSPPRPSPGFEKNGDTTTRHGQAFTLLDAVSLPASLIDQQYIYRWVNSRYANAHGKTPQEIIGQSVSSVWGEETFNDVIKGMLDRCFEGEASDSSLPGPTNKLASEVRCCVLTKMRYSTWR